MGRKNNKRSKKKLNIKRVVIAIVILLTIMLGIKIVLDLTKEVVVFKDFYLSSDTNQITLYTFDEENEIMTEIDTMYRGNKVKSNQKNKLIGDINYTEIKVDENV